MPTVPDQRKLCTNIGRHCAHIREKGERHLAPDRKSIDGSIAVSTATGTSSFG